MTSLKETDLAAYLKWMNESSKAFNAKPEDYKYQSIADFILQHGIECTPGGDWREHLKPGKKQECFSNAALAAIGSDDLTYVEGYAIGIIPVEHAWCIDNDGNVIDNTWIESPGTQYFGVPFSDRFLAKALFEKETYGLIDDWKNRHPLLRGVYEESEFLESRFSNQRV